MATATTGSRKKTDYQKLQLKATAVNCKGKGTKAELKAAEKKYRESAAAKGKTKAEIDKTVKKVLSKPCSAVAGMKKKPKKVAGYEQTRKVGNKTYVVYSSK